MVRIPGLLGLIIATGVLAQSAPDAGSIEALTWSGEFVNDDAKPSRELVVNAWYPASEPDDHWPLILLAPGRGVPSMAYTRVAEFLVSYGFVVVGIDSPGSGRQVFPDGRIVPPDLALEPPPGLMAGPYIEVDRFFSAAATAGAGDLVFVLDRIAEADAGSDMPFADQVDADRAGLLGHSLGGRIAGAFAAKDRRAVAWIGIEGVAPRAARRHGLGIPALAILSDGIWPYAIGNVRELAWCARNPTYFARMAGIAHNTITHDEPTATDEATSAGQRRLAETILSFFRHHMADRSSLLLEWPDGMSVEQHDAPSGEGPPGLVCNG